MSSDDSSPNYDFTLQKQSSDVTSHPSSDMIDFAQEIETDGYVLVENEPEDENETYELCDTDERNGDADEIFDDVVEVNDDNDTEGDADGEKELILEQNWGFGVPLAEAVRPKSLDDYIGQDHLLNRRDGRIQDFINLDYLPSMILHGPPGVGKTTLAALLAEKVGYVFVELSATDGTIEDLKLLLTTIAQENAIRSNRNQEMLAVVVFIDEIHRFRINQQDYLLPLIESGQFVFIGATTYNPYKRLRKAILSRCQLFELKTLRSEELLSILNRAVLLENIRRRVKWKNLFLSYNQESLDFLVARSKGDSRRLIQFIEMISLNHSGHQYEYDGGFAPRLVTVEDIMSTEITDVKSLGISDLYKQLFNVIRYPLSHYSKEDGSKEEESKEEEPNEEEPNEDEPNEDEPNEDEPNEDEPKEEEPNEEEPKKVLDYRKRRASFDSKESPQKSRKIKNSNDNFFRTDEPRFILKSDNPNDFQYASHMEFSDNEYESSGILSDTELDYEPIKPSDKLRFQVVVALNLLLQLLDHESPESVLKKLFLFSLMYINDNSQLPKFMALLKTLGTVRVNSTKLLSLIIERLIKLRKGSSLLMHLKVVKYFLSKTQTKETIEGFKVPEVSYDEDLVAEILTAPPPTMSSDTSDIMISALNFNDRDINLGVPPSNSSTEVQLLADIIPENVESILILDTDESDTQQRGDSDSDSDLTPMLSYPLNNLQEYDPHVAIWQ